MSNKETVGLRKMREVAEERKRKGFPSLSGGKRYHVVWVCNYAVADISGTEREGNVALQHNMVCVRFGYSIPNANRMLIENLIMMTMMQKA